MIKTITIFGSAIPGPTDEAYRTASRIGEALAKSGFAICNGGYGGTMEGSAKGARSAGGHTVGVTCRIFDRTVNEWIAEEVLTDTLEDRLKTLVARGNGYVLLPGGTGTLLELAYVLEAMNKEFITPRPIVLYGTFWDPVLGVLSHEFGMQRSAWVRSVISGVPDADAVSRRLVEWFARPSRGI